MTAGSWLIFPASWAGLAEVLKMHLILQGFGLRVVSLKLLWLLRLSCLWAVGARFPMALTMSHLLGYRFVVPCCRSLWKVVERRTLLPFFMHRINLNGGSLSSVKKSYLKDVRCYLFQIVLSHLSRSHGCCLWWLCVLVGFFPVIQQASTVCTRLLSLLTVKENPWSPSSELSLCVWPQLSFFTDLVFKEISLRDTGSAGSKKKYRYL